MSVIQTEDAVSLSPNWNSWCVFKGIPVACYPSSQVFLMYLLHALLEQVGKVGRISGGSRAFSYFPPASGISNKATSHSLKGRVPFSIVWSSKYQAQKLRSSTALVRFTCITAPLLPLPFPTGNKGLQEFCVWNAYTENQKIRISKYLHAREKFAFAFNGNQSFLLSSHTRS